MADQAKQQGNPANFELWHHDVQVASKIKAKKMDERNTTKTLELLRYFLV